MNLLLIKKNYTLFLRKKHVDTSKIVYHPNLLGLSIKVALNLLWNLSVDVKDVNYPLIEHDLGLH